MNEPALYVTYGIILVTCIISYLGFRDRSFEAKHIFCPEYILADKEYYRIITSAFLHSGWPHLIFNMVSFYCFASAIEFRYGMIEILAIYFGSIVGGSLLSLFLHRHHQYLAYGASGGVCGVIFASIFLLPGGEISMFFLPIGIPTWLYAVLFLAGTFYAMKAQRDNVAHDAHLGGAIFGLVMGLALHPNLVLKGSPVLFTSVSLLSIIMMVVIVKNPMFLPRARVAGDRKQETSRSDNTFLKAFKGRKSGKFNADELLDKISKEGLHSLTPEERKFLDNLSEKYRKRAESKKPDSELII